MSAIVEYRESRAVQFKIAQPRFNVRSLPSYRNTSVNLSEGLVVGDITYALPLYSINIQSSNVRYNLSLFGKDFTITNIFSSFEDPIERSFRSFADKWYEEILDEPTISGMTSNINYLHVIGLEPKAKVVSLILKELKSNCAPWFLALEILTGHDKVGKEYAGNPRKIADAWIKWGEQNRSS